MPILSEKPPRFEMRGIAKRFGGTIALDGVDLAVPGGEVHALIGENGAGKSTLMKVLSGALQPDGGTMRLDGAPFRPGSPLSARRQGVAMVYQELSLAPHLSVEENVLLGLEPTRWGVLRRREMRRRTAKALARLEHPEIRPEARAGALPVAAQQLVEIARAVRAGPHPRRAGAVRGAHRPGIARATAAAGHGPGEREPEGRGAGAGHEPGRQPHPLPAEGPGSGGVALSVQAGGRGPALDRPLRHPVPRPRPARVGAFGGQPAEGRAGPAAPPRCGSAASGRAHAGHRYRQQGRGLPADRRTGSRREGGPAGEQLPARTLGDLRPHRRDAPGAAGPGRPANGTNTG